GYTLIDTGLNYEKARVAWEEVFEDLHISPNEIHTIILTHFHPDHSGMAGWLQQKTGAEVWMSSTDLEMFQLAFQKEVQSANVEDRKSTRLNSSHVSISYAVFCLKKKKKQ